MHNSGSLASAAIETAASYAIIWYQTWFTISGITGFTLPGIIDEPGCIGGRLISFKPQRGPDDNQRRLLQIFDICTAASFRVADICTNEPAFWVASTRLRARLSLKPLTSDIFTRYGEYLKGKNLTYSDVSLDSSSAAYKLRKQMEKGGVS